MRCLICFRRIISKPIYLKFSIGVVIFFSFINIIPLIYLKFADKKYLDFEGRPPFIKKTAVLLVGGPKTELTEIGNVFNGQFHSFYIKDFLNLNINSECGKSQIKLLTKLLILIAQCDFKTAQNVYARYFDVNYKEKNCQNGNQCSPKYRMHLNDVVLSCQPNGNSEMLLTKSPRFSLVSKMCQKHFILFIQLKSQCDIEMLKNAFVELSGTNITSKIIHVVEDPRSMIYKVLREKNELASVKERSKIYCEHMIRDIEVGHALKSAAGNSSKIDYLVVRREPFELTRNVIMELVQKFIGHPYNSEMACRLFRNANQKLVSTKYDSWIFGWRRHFSIEIVKIIQEQCLPLLKKLNYLEVNLSDDLRDIENLCLFA